MTVVAYFAPKWPGLRDGSPAGPLGLALGEAEGKPSNK